MLGTVVHRYLREQGYECLTSDVRYSGRPDDPLIADVAASGADVVVNCAGITTQRQADDVRLLIVNALLPQHLAAVLSRSQMLVHPSTDCVFGGRGPHSVGSPTDAQDPYGLSKRLGENVLHAPSPVTVVLRTSIVGPENDSARGLLAWFLGETGLVKGWTDHLWNGITTLAWAKLCVEFATGARAAAAGLHQPTTSAAVSKYELLQLLAETYDHRIPIEPVETGRPVDCRLEPTLEMPPLAAQLAELRDWWGAEPA